MKKALIILITVCWYTAFSQVGIGTATPDISSALDVSSTNKGFLTPRIALTSSIDVATIATPATGLLIYNTATAGTAPNTVAPGYYYWNGSQWTGLGAGISDLRLVGNGNHITQDAGTGGNGTSAGTGANNVGIGGLALSANTIGEGSIAIGTATLSKNVSGNYNIALGYQTMENNINGYLNTGIGYRALRNNTSGYRNVAFGDFALYANTTGNSNTAIGESSLNKNSSGVLNTAVGLNALYEKTTGDQNIAVGNSSAVDQTDGSRNIFIGSYTFVSNKTGSNLLNIGNNIYGTNVNSPVANSPVLAANLTVANIGINTETPVAPLDIQSTRPNVTTSPGNTVVNAGGSINDYLQNKIQNSSAGIQAQSGFVAVANNGTNTTNMAWMGINSSTFNYPRSYNIGMANDVTFIGTGNDMYLANSNLTRSIIFATGQSTTPFFTERMRISGATGNVGIGTNTPVATLHNNGTTAFTVGTSGTAKTVILQNGGTFTPPDPVTNNGVMYIIRNTDIVPMSVTDIIDYMATAPATFSLTGAITIISNGTNWYRIQ